MSFWIPDARSRQRLWWMYHLLFLMLLAHFALVYLKPGYFTPARSNLHFVSGSGHGSMGAARIFERDGRTWLWAGEDENDHFDITQFRLDPSGLKYGLGREVFPALIEPFFDKAESADQWLSPDARVLAVVIADQVRVYPIDLLIRHEVVNDVVDGVPIFAAYCILADLGAVYDRRYGDHVLTFALTGYTYSDPTVWDGMDAFVLWDRETESQWWPPIGLAVSGDLMDQPLNLLDQKLWLQTTWGEIRRQYPQAQVLMRGQDFERPRQWPRLSPIAIQEPGSAGEITIAPRWGEGSGKKRD